MADGEVKVKESLRGRIDVPRALEIDWLAGDDGSVPEKTTPVVHGNVTRITTIPDGDDAPSAYNLYVLDEEGIDLMSSAGEGRSGTGRGQLLFENPVAVNSALTICITGQANAGAKGKILVYLDRIQS